MAKDCKLFYIKINYFEINNFSYIAKAKEIIKTSSMAKLEMFTLEFPVKATPRVLYTLISSAEGLSRWFADIVDIEKDDIFKFKWEDSEQSARMIQSKENEYVRFQWQDNDYKDYFFELKILTEPVSSEVALVVTDYADPNDLDFSKRLWNTQVGILQRMFNST